MRWRSRYLEKVRMSQEIPAWHQARVKCEPQNPSWHQARVKCEPQNPTRPKLGPSAEGIYEVPKFDKSSGANQCYLGGQKFWSSTGGMVAASELKQFDFVRAANGELIRAMSIDVHPDSLIILGRWWTMLQVCATRILELEEKAAQKATREPQLLLVFLVFLVLLVLLAVSYDEARPDLRSLRQETFLFGG